MYTKKTLTQRYAGYGWLICCLAALFYSYEYLLRIEPSVMTQELRHHFVGLSATGLGLLSSMYYWAYTPMQMLVGVMTDRYGPKRILTAAIILCVIGTAIFMHTSSIYVAGCGRFLVGMGSAFAFVGALKLAAMWLPHRHFALFAGLTTSIGMLGALAGDIVMTWVVHHVGWYSVLNQSVIIGLVLIPIFFFFVQDKIVHEPALNRKKSLKPYLIDFFKLFLNRHILIAGFIGCLLFSSLSAFGEMWGIPFLQAIMPEHQITASTINSMVFLGWMVGGPFGGWLSEFFRSRRLPLMFGSIAATVTISIVLIDPHLTPMTLGILLFLFGVFCSVQILCFAVARDYVDTKLAGSAASAINMLVMLSGMLLQPAISHVLDWVWSGDMHAGIRVYDVNDYRLALAILPVAMLISAVLAFFMKDSLQGTRK